VLFLLGNKIGDKRGGIRMSLKPVPMVKIKSFKHSGKIHRVWEKNMILSETPDALITVNDQVLVTEGDGSYWRTKEPAISFFSKIHWFNIVALFQAKGIKYYCNLASPVVVKDGALHYIDYDLDVEVEEGKPPRLLDQDEYQKNSLVMNYPAEVKDSIERELEVLYHWIEQKEVLFQEDVVMKWYKKYQQLDVKWDEN
jgi:uncharacterized protein